MATVSTDHFLNYQEEERKYIENIFTDLHKRIINNHQQMNFIANVVVD